MEPSQKLASPASDQACANGPQGNHSNDEELKAECERLKIECEHWRKRVQQLEEERAACQRWLSAQVKEEYARKGAERLEEELKELIEKEQWSSLDDFIGELEEMAKGPRT
jgi:hypothetical protein